MTEQKVSTTRGRSPAKKRVPVSGNRDILTVAGKNEDYFYRWVNDVDNRIQKFLDAGYVFAEPTGKLLGDSTTKTHESIARKGVGKGVTSYLMAIKKEWYEEDQLAKMERVDGREGSLNNSGHDGRYGDIKLKVRTGSL